MSILRSINGAINGWLTAPEVNAAGRMSLFRIVYGLFYLWHVRPLSYYAVWTEIPGDQWSPIATFAHFNIGRPNPLLFEVAPVVLIASLVLLIIGFRTRLATSLVLISGIFLTGSYYSFTGKVDHADTFLVAYIPAIMLFSRWGSNYSLDALLQEREGRQINASDSSWVYSWPMRAVLLLLALMFFGAGYFKLRAGQWLTDMDLLPRLLTTQNAIAVMRSLDPNPFYPWIANTPWVHIPLQFGGVFFELFFPLTLLSHRLRNLFVSSGVLFHAFNTFFLGINAYPMIIIYLTFVDWQAIYARWWPFHLGKRVKQLPTPALIGLALLLAGIVPVLWKETNLLRPPGDFGGILTPVTIWYFAIPLALYCFIRSVYQLVQGIFSGLANRQQRHVQARLAR
jgi:hypothetical protein